MDQKKTGQFLKTLRKEKQLTQEGLAEKLGVSGRTVSRWETGTNMPDISLLVELAEFYQVSIPEIIDGERKSEDMNQETKETAVKLAEYSKHEVHAEKRKILSVLLTIFGLFVIGSALAVFPNDSSWGSIYSILGGIGLVTGIALLLKPVIRGKNIHILCIAGCIALLFGFFTLSDYVTVTQFHQVPRFSYEKTYGTDEVVYQTIFFTAVQKNPGTNTEEVALVGK